MIEFDIEKAKKKIQRMPQYIKSSISSTSEKTKFEVFEKSLPIAPHWRENLRYSVLTESYNFVEKGNTMEQHLVYDAWNPRTGFHYAELRYYETTTGVPRWATYGMQDAQPFIEKILIDAVKKGVGKNG